MLLQLYLVKKECHTNRDCEAGLLPCLPTVETHKDWSHELLTTYYKHYRKGQGQKYCMGSHLAYPGINRNQFGNEISNEIFRGVETPHTGGGKY